jgi:membrane-associated phospholipid phosphatase
MILFPHYFDKNLFFKFVKSSELTLFYYYIISTLFFFNKKFLFLASSIIINSYINYFLKHSISVPIFSKFNDIIPIFGQGSRPIGAVDCGYFDNCPGKVAKSFGFPSGHSQFAGLQVGFYIRDIIIKSKDKNLLKLKNEEKFKIIFLFLLMFTMMYTRIYIEKCHTIEQTIFGSIIGLILGYQSNKFYYKYFV